ncbi:uncharacterized protein LOC141906301 [Tubulanus polymorphus]|uniref:uncharacterized protein LOC141906301 n=1 Tax=Tubulanus polymorphus TaxID=672921 RepID=UPI003DA5FF01
MFNGAQMWSYFTTPVSTPCMMTPRRLEPLDEKIIELDKMKKDIYQHLKKLNNLRSEYTEWFENRHKSFTESLIGARMLIPELFPEQVYTIKHFKQTKQLCQTLIDKGRYVSNVERMNEFEKLWEKMVEIKEAGDEVVYEQLCKYCTNITALRDPNLKEQIDDLQYHLQKACSEDFNFKDIHNERDNLFTYKLDIGEKDYLGLVQFIPYLLQITRKICYLGIKLHVEKE